MTRGIVGTALLLGTALALPAAAPADWGVAVDVRVGHAPARWGGGPAYRHGYDRGWREGSEEGHRDGRKRREARYWRENEYRDGDRGYRRWMGPRWDYVAGFRRGYEEGYRRAYAAARPGWGRDRWRERPPERRRDGGRHDRW